MSARGGEYPACKPRSDSPLRLRNCGGFFRTQRLIFPHWNSDFLSAAENRCAEFSEFETRRPRRLISRFYREGRFLPYRDFAENCKKCSV